MGIIRHRAIAAATAAAVALTAMAATPASAHSHRHSGIGGAVVLGAVAGLFGTIATLAARDHAERHYGYRGYAPYPPPRYGYGYGYGYGPYYR